MAEVCTFCFPQATARMRGSDKALTSSWHTIERYALNKEGAVGSFYDAWTDNLLTTSSINKDSLLQKDIKHSPTCRLMKVDNLNRDNVLTMIGIEDDLRISIALNMTQVNEGTLLLNTYQLPTDRPVRLIDYHHVNQEECLSNDVRIVRKNLPELLPNNNATHVISSVRRGFDFVIVLELPENADHNEVDSALDRLCEYFTKSEAAFLSIADRQKISCLQLTIFTSISEIHSFAENKNLSDVCQYIRQYIDENRNNFPLSYTLHPVKCIYYNNLFNEKTYYRLDPWIVREIDERLLPLSNRFKRMERLLHEKVFPQLSQRIQPLSEQACKDLRRVKEMYINVQQALATKVNVLRRSSRIHSLFDSVLDTAQFRVLDSELETLWIQILELKKKACFIINIETDHHMEYLNVAVLEGSDDDRQTLENKPSSLDQKRARCYLCSSDELVRSNAHQYDKILQPLVPLQRVPSVMESIEMNVLLVGETGVGKSTFINAFVNYLAFHSLQQAATGEPIVLIPVSFVITSGDQFQEKIIEFGQCDSNENHNQLGQSVTQYCRSYIFNIASNIKLRIIDTPGIGDTRGVEQDYKNIEYILSYTNNLPHLNAICFLLKPNTTRLHALFRSCFTQLFDFLGPAARDNIIFCFTNTRATFYAPGETGKLVREMLTRLPNDHIPSFDKRNTFCFDSESFRYLAIIKAKHKLELDDKEKLEFENSWKMSVTESARLLDFIKSRPPYKMNKWHSIKHAQMMITLLVRPILETVRNALRNLVLHDIGNNRDTIELLAHSISLPAWVCTVCPYETTRVDSISVVTHPVQYYCTSNECGRCHCCLDKHLPIFYALEHRLCGTKGKGFYPIIENMKQRLLDGSVIMSQFLLHTAHVSGNPFLPWFELLAEEEQQLSQQHRSNGFHHRLYENIRDVKTEHENRTNDNQFDRDQIELNGIYGCIEEVLAYSSIAEQMNAIKASQIEMMKNDEHDVSSQYPHIDMTKLVKHSTATTNH